MKQAAIVIAIIGGIIYCLERGHHMIAGWMVAVLFLYIIASS